MKFWNEIKEEYQNWEQDDYGYFIHPTEKFRFGIGDGAKIGDWAKIGKQLTYIIGSIHQVYLYDPKKKMIGIGCIVLTIAEWKTKGGVIAKRHGYTNEQINEYKKYIDLFDGEIRTCY